MAVKDFKALRRFITKMTRENLWIYILRLLQESPKYGYEIRDMIDRRFGFRPATVTSYVILYKMARDGLVETKRAESEAKGKPDRKYYVITKEGEQAMQAAKIILTKLMKNAFDLT